MMRNMTNAKPRRSALVKPPSRKRRGQTVEAGRLVAALAAPALKRHGHVDHELRKRWRAMVGEKLARFTAPERLKPARGGRGATLVLTVESGAGPLVEHQLPFLLEVINQYYGYRAVERIELANGEVVRRSPPARPPIAAAAESTPQQALSRLARAIISDTKSTD